MPTVWGRGTPGNAEGGVGVFLRFLSLFFWLAGIE